MNRIFPTLGFHYRASGELYWLTNFVDTCTKENLVGNCPVDELHGKGMDAWKDQLVQGGNGDGTLTYPGRDDVIGGGKDKFVPIASIRLKQLRDGMEDHEYWQLAGKYVGDAKVRKMLEEVVKNSFTY